MEKFKIKCPVCGNEDFLEIEPPYYCGMDTYIEDCTEYYACSNCGLVLRFAKGVVDRKLEEEFLNTDNGKKWSSLNNELKRIISSSQELEKKNEYLNDRLKDDRRSVASDRQMRIDLKENQNKLRENKKRVLEIEEEMKKLRK